MELNNEFKSGSDIVKETVEFDKLLAGILFSRMNDLKDIIEKGNHCRFKLSKMDIVISGKETNVKTAK
jgi:hypothetical protein